MTNIFKKAKKNFYSLPIETLKKISFDFRVASASLMGFGANKVDFGNLTLSIIGVFIFCIGILFWLSAMSLSAYTNRNQKMNKTKE